MRTLAAILPDLDTTRLALTAAEPYSEASDDLDNRVRDLEAERDAAAVKLAQATEHARQRWLAASEAGEYLNERRLWARFLRLDKVPRVPLVTAVHTFLGIEPTEALSPYADGGYPIAYYSSPNRPSEMDTLCWLCAEKERHALVAVDVIYEGNVDCDQCSQAINREEEDDDETEMVANDGATIFPA